MTTRGVRVLEFIAVVVGFSAFTICLTYPLALNLSTLGYKLEIPGDSQYSVWNVAWVSHALLNDPLGVVHSNIFYPHRWTLFYSEANLGAGLLAVPAMWLTGNAFAAHNSAVLLSFVLSATAMYYLVRHLVGDRRAALIGAMAFAFCPYAFSHLRHIQLLMTSGIPLSMLAFHRLVERPGAKRGAMLGLAVAWQAIACAYYTVFVVLLIGLSALVTFLVERRWKDTRLWISFGAAAGVAALVIAPLSYPYLLLQQETGFRRTLQDAIQYSATWSSYLTSAAYLSGWMHPLLPKWTDVLFPGYMATIFGIGGIAAVWQKTGRDRFLAILYSLVGGLALWESFGPDGGLYTLTYHLVPAFSFIRAPSRFGVLVVLALSVLASMSIARLLARSPRATLIAALLIAIAVAARITPIPLTANPSFHSIYATLANEPPGGLVELPLYSHGANYFRTQYMLASTVHWKGLVNAYSDMIPEEFSSTRDTLGTFPSDEAFDVLADSRTRYAIFHIVRYRELGLEEQLKTNLSRFGRYLRRIDGDDDIALYEILGYPSDDVMETSLEVRPPPPSPR